MSLRAHERAEGFLAVCGSGPSGSCERAEGFLAVCGSGPSGSCERAEGFPPRS
ncbi:MAG: hypothetical protein V5A18_02005 [Haloarculaceae archaeon]